MLKKPTRISRKARTSSKWFTCRPSTTLTRSITSSTCALRLAIRMPKTPASHCTCSKSRAIFSKRTWPMAQHQI